ncbi:MAG TPA: hypothetical protein VFA15_05465, partial [Nitrososphaera sp.]|nr:hypothetical protein [Nitrososphaera sp.]
MAAYPGLQVVQDTDPEAIFDRLLPSSLHKIAGFLRWDPVVSSKPPQRLLRLSDSAQLEWLDRHRMALRQHLSWVGTPLFSYINGRPKSYSEIVRDVARKLNIE